MATRKKFYAVAKGRMPGIYAAWSLAKAQVDGFPGACYQGFVDQEEAENWLTRQGPQPKEITEVTSSRSAGPKVKPAGLASGGGRDRAPSGQGSKKVELRDSCLPPQGEPQAKTPSAPAGKILIYTDGGAQGNPGPGGYGVVQIVNGQRRELAGGYRLTTNNRMELMACIVALAELGRCDQPIQLFSDSGYVVNGINKRWAQGWRRRGWRKADGRPALNTDLWSRLLDLEERLTVKFNWIRGHAGNPLNERCDQLAVAMARQPGLPADSEYEKLLHR